MIRRLANAACDALAWRLVAPIFWLARLADPTVCAWTNHTAGEDER